MIKTRLNNYDQPIMQELCMIMWAPLQRLYSPSSETTALNGTHPNTLKQQVCVI